jgi:hypothetical protein
VHRRKGEETARSALLEMRPRVLRKQERARQEKSEERVPALLGELDQGCDMLKTGVRDDGVESTEALDGTIDRSLVSLARREIGGERFPRTGFVGRYVDRQNERTHGHEPLCDRAPDPARGACDDDGTAAELSGAHVKGR